MTPEQFCYWLNGFGELTTERPTAEQWKAIKEHLGTVFKKVTPTAPGDQLNDLQKLIRSNRELVGPMVPQDWGKTVTPVPTHPFGGLQVTC